MAMAVLAVVLAAAAPSYFSAENLSDLFLANMPVFVVALGATLVILAGEIDISVGSVFAVAGVVAGVVAKLGAPGGVWTTTAAACAVGAIVGAVNGALVAYLQVPSIVVTLAMMVALRDGLRWATEGAWVENLPPDFQWFGLPQSWYPVLLLATLAILQSAIAWGMRHVAAGRMVYATGSNASAARLAGIDVAALKCWVFVVAGTLTALAAVLNAVRVLVVAGTERAHALLARTAAENRRCGSREAADALRRLDRAKAQAAGTAPADAAKTTTPTSSSTTAPSATSTVDTPSSTSIVPTPPPAKKIAKKKKVRRKTSTEQPKGATTAATSLPPPQR